MVDIVLGPAIDALVRRLADACRDRGLTLATAESLTGGQLAAAISSGPESGSWYRGGIVAYHPSVKYTLLGAPRGPVVRPETAVAMAESTARILNADYAAAVTGVGGPEPQEGKPAGTVFLATVAPERGARVEPHVFSGEPAEVLAATVEATLTALLGRILE